MNAWLLASDEAGKTWPRATLSGFCSRHSDRPPRSRRRSAPVSHLDAFQPIRTRSDQRARHGGLAHPHRDGERDGRQAQLGARQAAGASRRLALGGQRCRDEGRGDADAADEHGAHDVAPQLARSALHRVAALVRFEDAVVVGFQPSLRSPRGRPAGCPRGPRAAARGDALRARQAGVARGHLSWQEAPRPRWRAGRRFAAASGSRSRSWRGAVEMNVAVAHAFLSMTCTTLAVEWWSVGVGDCL